MTVAIARPPWLCSPQSIKCENDHTLWFNKAGYRADLRDMTGHMFLECKDCSTYFLAVFHKDPSPMVYCYPLSKESYDEWQSRKGNTPPTLELLYLLRDPNGRSHYPNFRPR